MSQPPQDEVWITEDGTEILVGNLTEAHAKNILRMILRRRREEEEAIRAALAQAVPQLTQMVDMIAEETGLSKDQIREDFRIAGIEIPTEGNVAAPDAITTNTGIDELFDRITPPTDPRKLN